MKNITTRQALFWLAVATPVLVHTFLLYRYSINAPRLDDFSDGFVFLTNFYGTDAPDRKIDWLFSVYQNHRWGFLHAVYALYGCIDFRSANWISMPCLLSLLWLWHCVTRDKPYHAPLLLSASLLIFNLQTWTGMFWITASLAAFPSVTLALLAFTLATRGNWSATLLAIGISFLATFTNGNGTMIWPMVIGYLCLRAILQPTERRFLPILLWTATGALALTLYFSDAFFLPVTAQEDRVAGVIQKIIGDPLLFIRGILATVGSNMIYPMKESTDWGVNLAIVMGATECTMFAWLLINGALRDKPALVLLALYIGATMAAIAASRVMFLGIGQAFQGHYKLYNGIFLLLLFTAMMDWCNRQPMTRATWVLPLGRSITALTAAMYLASMVLFLPATDSYHRELKEDTRNWLHTHNLLRSESRFLVKNPNRKLEAAVEGNYYNPWTLLEKTEKPQASQLLQHCIANGEPIQALMESQKAARAVHILFTMNEKAKSLAVCSPLQSIQFTLDDAHYTQIENGTYRVELWVPRDTNIKADEGPWQLYLSP